MTDDGPGFTVSAPHQGAGLQNMHDRVAALGGRLSIANAPAHGTVVTGAIPLREGDGTNRVPA